MRNCLSALFCLSTPSSHFMLYHFPSVLHRFASRFIFFALCSAFFTSLHRQSKSRKLVHTPGKSAEASLALPRYAERTQRCIRPQSTRSKHRRLTRVCLDFFAMSLAHWHNLNLLFSQPNHINCGFASPSSRSQPAHQRLLSQY